MADIEGARAEVQKVVSLLVNRFGHEHEVFAHLSLALDHLRETPPKPGVVKLPVAVAEAQSVEAAAIAQVEEVLTEESEAQPAARPPTNAAPRHRR